jgi:hypothetical protein
VRELAETRSPALVYSLILNRLLGRNGEGLDEDRIVKIENSSNQSDEF